MILTLGMRADPSPYPVTLIPTSSRVGRCLLVGGGNRQLNAALHRMALNQTTMTDLAVLSSTAASPWQHQDGGLRAWKHSLARIVFKAPARRPAAHLHSLPAAA